MTPTQHRTAAEQLLPKIDAPRLDAQDNAEIFEIATTHAILAKTTGTGTDYTEAESFLADAEAAQAMTSRRLQLARHAHLRALLVA